MKGIFASIKDFWTKRPLKQRLTFGALALVTVVAIVALLTLNSHVPYTVLFSGMTEAETSQIYEELKTMGVAVKAQSTTLLVPQAQADDLRLTLSSKGLPQTGYNYDIFNSSSFTSTESETQTRLGYQLEQNIAQTLKRMEKVQDALVKITLPKDSKFALSSLANQPSLAAVMLVLKEGQKLTDSEAETIRALVLRSVPQLLVENITITDSAMNTYEISTPDAFDASNQQFVLQEQMQTLLQKQVYDLLVPIFGPSNLSVAVNVMLDFDKKAVSSVKYDPPSNGDNSGIIISMLENTELVGDAGDISGAVGVDPNGGAPTYPVVNGEFEGSYYKYTKEFNAEVDETREQIEYAQGQIRSLSVAVLLNGGDELAGVLPGIQSATAKAVGVSEEHISIVALPFNYTNKLAEEAAAEATATPPPSEPAQEQEGGEVLMWWIFGGVILVLLLVVVLAVVSQRQQHALLIAALASKKKEEEEAQQALPEHEAQPQEDVPQEEAYEPEYAEDDYDDYEDYDEAYDEEEAFPLEEDIPLPEDNSPTKQVIGQIQRLADTNPEAIAQLLRNWLSDDIRR